MNNWCTEYLNSLHLMIVSLPALRGPFHLRYNLFVLMHLTFSMACDSYRYRTLCYFLGHFYDTRFQFLPFFFLQNPRGLRLVHRQFHARISQCTCFSSLLMMFEFVIRSERGHLKHNVRGRADSRTNRHEFSASEGCHNKLELGRQPPQYCPPGFPSTCTSHVGHPNPPFPSTHSEGSE